MRDFKSIGTRIEDDIPFVVRVDGRSFHRFAEMAELRRPFDTRFHVSMVNSARQFVEDGGLSPIFAYGQSDEVSFLFEPSIQLFNRRVEKFCSVSAGFMSSALTMDWREYWHQEIPLGFYIVFDARVIPLKDSGEVIEYFDNRQHDAWRNCVSSYAFWHLVLDGGLTKSQATRKLERMGTEGRIEFLQEEFEINVSTITAWHRRGFNIEWTEVEKQGYNPITDEHVTAIRHKAIVNESIPSFSEDDGKNLILKSLGEKI